MNNNKIKKSITVIFLNINASDEFFSSFPSHFRSIGNDESKTRIINHRGKKHLIKIQDNIDDIEDAYAFTVVKERNTWQTRATKDGSITGINQNQGIVGDPYFLCAIPRNKMIFGFTSGPSGTVKSVAKFVLEQFNSNRSDKILINLIPKEKEFDSLNDVPEFSSLQFNLNSSLLNDLTENAPEFIKQLGSAPYIGQGMQLSFNLDINEENESEFSKENILEIINFLSDHDGCSVLKVKGLDHNGKNLSLDFSNAFLTYKTEINTRNKFIDEKCSTQVLSAAYSDYLKKLITTN
ncbi:hypothetical protein [Pectobacterium aroidearum]|uniref:hypothetical protein n=1 Tax=Pectobacterium aroidearum TaxID=1201031 RepID=UPI0015DF09E0|nr:hypothetical protein [Pectobacterium aroidearum]MBA0203916.1 hypothetical protein [Pectobacterium aroidearum]